MVVVVVFLERVLRVTDPSILAVVEDRLRVVVFVVDMLADLRVFCGFCWQHVLSFPELLPGFFILI